MLGSREHDLAGSVAAPTLGGKIRTARLEEKLTQEQLAGKDFTKSYVSELERGARTPRLTTLKILARRLNRPLSYFLDGVPEEQEAEAYLTIGTAWFHAGAVEEAQESLERALDAAVQQGDDVLQARIELALAAVDRRLRRTLRAGRRIDRSLRTLGRVPDTGLLAHAQALRGRVKLDEGDAMSALWAFEAALRFAKHLADPCLLADIYGYLGVTYRWLGRAQDSQDAFRLALEAAEPLEDQHRIGAWLLGLATTAARQGRFDQAAEQAGKALVLYEAIKHKRRLAEIHERLGETDLRVDRWEEAQQHYRWSVALHGAAGNFLGAAQTLGCLVEAMLNRTSPEAARAMGEMALDLLPKDADPWQRAHTLRVRGSICRVLGRADEARAALDESLRLLEELRRPDDARLVRRELVLLAMESQDLDTACHHLKILWESSELRSPPLGL